MSQDGEKSERSRPRTALMIALALVMSLYVICAVPVLALAAMLFAHACTAPGRLFAAAVLVGLAAPVLLSAAAYTKRRKTVLVAGAACGLLAVLLLGTDYLLAPDGLAPPGSPARSCFTGATAYRRASMANLVPEMDQLVLGTYVVPTVDRFMDGPNTAELRHQVRAVYGEMRASPEFERLGSVMDQAYRDLFFGQRPIGHFYEYVPAGTEERLPVVIFLHGSLGNFRGYLWVWKSFADRHRVAVVAPTFGAGRWNEPGGAEAVDAALRYCTAHPRMDPSRVYLAGLSNGGLGVCLAARQSPDAYRGLILISPVLDLRSMFAGRSEGSLKDKPVLILHGAADNRVPLGYVQNAAEEMRAFGMRVDTVIYGDQSHFLFFTLRDRLQERIGSWMGEVTRPRQGPD
jgi:pimeloyl-ACP methyl ester carboxylesterase